jgi:hypothetical protein
VLDCGQQAFDLRILVRSNKVMKLVPAFGRMIPTTPTPKARMARFEMSDSGIDVSALTPANKRRAAPTSAPSVFNERAALLLPLMGLAACGGGGTAAPPGPAPGPPATELTVTADRATFTAGGTTLTLAGGGTTVLANDAQVAGTTVSAVGPGTTAGANGNFSAVGALGTLTVNNTTNVASYTTGAGGVALAEGAPGTDTFTYTASNATTSPTSASTTLTITVTGVNDVPNAQADKSISLAVGATTTNLAITAPVDPDTGDTLRLSSYTLPTAGQLLKADNTVVTASNLLLADLTGLKYNPTGVAGGNYTFTYTVTDRAAGTTGLSDTQIITLAVAAPPPPTGPVITLGAGVVGVTALTGAAGSGFGTAIAGGGDVNGDSLNDLVVGAPGSGNGAIQIFFGTASGANVSTTASATIAGAEAASRFGASVAISASGGTSSINGDARADIIVGAPLENAGGANDTGAAYIVFGSATLPADVATPATSTLVRVIGLDGNKAAYDGTNTEASALSDGVGYTVVSPGDINGDGRADYIIGAPGAENGNVPVIAGQTDNDSGAGLVGYGPTSFASANLNIGSYTGSSTIGTIIRGEGSETNEYFSSISALGNFNGGATSELAFSSPFRDVTPSGAARTNNGIVYIESNFTQQGTTFNVATADFTVVGAATGDRLGTSIAFGDVNGDSFSDLIIGAPGADTGGVDSGAVFIVYGAATNSLVSGLIDLNALTFTNGLATAGGLNVVRIAGSAAGQGFGASVAFVGNFDGTGGDFAVGTSGTTGDAYVINGGAAASVGTRNIASPNGTDVTQLDGTGTGTVVVTGLGDINGGGLADVGVGIASANSAFIVYGRGAGQTGTSLSVSDTGLAYDSSVDALLTHFAGPADAAATPATSLADFAFAMPMPALDHLQTADMA